MDRELQQALDVDPSPEFLARVRQRIATSEEPRRSRSWAFAALSACVVTAAVVAVGVSRPAVQQKSGGELLASRTLGSMAVTPGIVASSIAGTVEDDPGAVEMRRAKAPSRATGVAEILIDQREVAALRHFLSGGPLRPEAAYAGPGMDPIEIEPIVIAPLETSGEGVRQ